MSEEMKVLADLLREQAADIARRGIKGIGNAMLYAADELERLETERDRLALSLAAWEEDDGAAISALRAERDKLRAAADAIAAWAKRVQETDAVRNYDESLSDEGNLLIKRYYND